ncbi:class I glutamine amidotransferase-like protein [Mycena floridula]|nr:class I glutamine amidotransferase-like protein [Mycena floridula]
MSHPKSIALLVCDTPIGDVVSDHGDYHAIFTTLLNKVVPYSDGTVPTFKLDAYEVRDFVYPSEETIDTYDAVMLTGSAASAYDDIPWIKKLVKYVAWLAENKPHIKIIGICFGHQIVAEALGGSCVPNNQWEIGPTPLELTILGKEIFGVDELNIQQMHRDHVPTIPKNFHLLGSTAVSVNQGMVKFSSSYTDGQVVNPSQIHVFTVQGHPEFTEPIVSKIIEVRTRAGVIPLSQAQDSVKRKDWRNDGVIIAKGIWRVLAV